MFRLRFATRPLDFLPHLKRDLEKSIRITESILNGDTLRIKALYRGYE